jgi:hypothetical protein
MDCQLGAGERIGAAPSCGTSSVSTGEGAGEGLLLRWEALLGRFDMESEELLSRLDDDERALLPSNDDDTVPPSESRLPVGSMSEAAAVPVAPTRHRHPKM